MTNEVRLIDANALIKKLKSDFDDTDVYTDKDQFIIDCIHLLENAPTVTIDNYALGYQDGVRKVLSELAEQGHEFGNIFGDCKPTFEATVKEEQENDK